MTVPATPSGCPSPMDIGRTLVSLCREGKNDEAMERLYATDVVSVEAGAGPGMDRVSHGVAAARAKGDWWRDNHEVHDAKVTGPWPHDDRFIVVFTYDVTFKPSGNRFVMEEAGLYTVANGKITREEFFYAMG